MPEAARQGNASVHGRDVRRTGVLARKMGMTRIFDEHGNTVAVTVLCLSGCRVIGHMTEKKNGYNALQLGAGEVKVVNLTKAERGIFAAAKVEPAREVAEFRVPDEEALLPIGSVITADHFVVGQYVDVKGTTVGKGFAGGIKRHGFGGLRATHGVSISHRSIGSTGGRQDPGKTFKNKKMPGQMGGDKVTTLNLEVIGTDVVREVIYVRGAVPGRNGWVKVRDAVKKSLPKAAPLPGAFQQPDVKTELMESLPQRGKPVSQTENLGKMAPAGELERGLMQAFIDLEEGDPANRLAAIGTMLAKAVAARRAKTDRAARKRVRAMEKAFVDALFDDETSVRWAAAYAIAVLEDPKHQLEEDKIPPSGQVGESRERYVRDVLERYFRTTDVELLTSLSLDLLEQQGDRMRLKLEARVSRELPVTLAGRAALTGTEDTLKSGSKLTITVTDTSGTVNEIVENTTGDADTTVRAETQVSVPAGENGEIFVDFVIDGRSLNTLSVPVRLILEREGYRTELKMAR